MSSSSLAALAAFRMAKAKAQKPLNTNLPMPLQPIPVPKAKKRIGYQPLQREVKLLKSYTAAKMFQMGGNWGNYGLTQLEDGRRVSRRLVGMRG